MARLDLPDAAEGETGMRLVSEHKKQAMNMAQHFKFTRKKKRRQCCEIKFVILHIYYIDIFV